MNKIYFISYLLNKKLITKAPAVELVCAFGLNLTIQTAGRFVFGVIVPIPPHTPNISHTKSYELKSIGIGEKLNCKLN